MSFLSKSIITGLLLALALFILSLTLPSPSGHSHIEKTTILPQSSEYKTDHKQRVNIVSGDSLSSIFSRMRIHQSNINQMDATARSYLRNLSPNKILTVSSHNSQLTFLSYPINDNQNLIISRTSNGLITHINTTDFEDKLNYKLVTIQHSLFQSLRKAHVSRAISRDIQRMFAGSVDLDHHIHPGDQLEILYKDYYLNGVHHHAGHAVAARLHSRATTYTAFRYTNSRGKTGYYQSNGKSVDPLFLNFPLHFKRVSSPFSLDRLDPVTHKHAPHLGVDLAAKTGTPIRSIGNGRVRLARWVTGFGKTVEINYGHHRMSLYAHLSRYKKGLHRGQFVQKGEIVGYVGQTGWATGPHLHFGFFVKNKAVNWLRYKQPTAPAIRRKEKKAFKQSTRTWISQMDLQKSAYQVTHQSEHIR